MSAIKKLTDAKCIFCGGQLSWDGQELAYKRLFGYDKDEEAMVYYLRCRRCGRDYDVSDPVIDERESDYAEYWNNRK